MSLDICKTDVGRNFRLRRLERGWTQAELAERAGLGMQMICRLETTFRNPTLETLRDVAFALGCSVADLVAANLTDPQLPVPTRVSYLRELILACKRLDIEDIRLLSKIAAALSVAQFQNKTR